MKTYVLDASALLAFLEKKTSAPRVNELLAKESMRGRALILMSAVNYGEVYGKALREYGPERAGSDHGRSFFAADNFGRRDLRARTAGGRGQSQVQAVLR